MKARYHEQLLNRARIMRKNPTIEERKLWKRLRKKQVAGHRFRRQYILAPFIVDFYCYAKKLAIEIDGKAHQDQSQSDRQRDEYLQTQYQVRVIRILAEDVQRDFESVVAEIRAALE